MVIDDKFIENFRYQVGALTSMKKSIEAAIEKGNDMLGKMKPGDPMEKFFPRDPAKAISPAAKGGGG